MLLFVILYRTFFAFLDPAALSNRATALLQKEENIALARLKQLPHHLDSHDHHKKEKKSTVLYLGYQNDTIVLWSNNHEPIPYLLSEFSDLNQPTFELENGIFYPIVHQDGEYTFVALIPIYYQYPVENEYFSNRFAKFLQLPDNALYSCEESPYSIISGQGEWLCSINFPKDGTFSGNKYRILLILFIICYLGALFCIYQSFFYHLYQKPKISTFLGCIVSFVIVAGFVVFMRYPAIIFNHELFSSKYFAYSALFPSLGQILFLSFAFAVICFAVYDLSVLWRQRQKPAHVLLNILPPICSGFLFMLLFVFHKMLILNTTVFLDLSFIFNINAYSILLLITLCCFSIAVFLLNITCTKWIGITSKKSFVIFLITAVIILLIIAYFIKFRFSIFTLSLLWIIAPALFVYSDKRIEGRYLFYVIILLGVISTTILVTFTDKIEKRHRLFLAEEFSQKGRQEDRELLFDNLSQNILKDNSIRKFILNFNDSIAADYDHVICDYIIRHYLNKNWQGYHHSINICSPADTFYISSSKSHYSCIDYFKKQVENGGQKTLSPNLYLLNNESFSFTYLGIIDIKKADTTLPNLIFFIEMHPIHPYRESGYPEFLLDESALTLMDASRYSYAIYENNELEYSFGTVTYPLQLSESIKWDSSMLYSFYTLETYDLLRYRMSNNRMLIISTPIKNIPQVLSPFIYMIAVYLALMYGLLLFTNKRFLIASRSQLSAKLQRAILLVLSLAFVLIGITFFYFVNFINKGKDFENLHQKTQSIMTAINTFDEIYETSNLNNINKMILDLSIVFYADINVYLPNGELFVTSSPNIFEQGLLSELINYEVFCKILHRREHSVIQDEYIGNKHYLSSYSAVYDDVGKISYIINVTYFSHSAQYEYEVASFISTFINIYIIVFLIFLFTLLYLSNQITLPVQILTQYFGKIRIGQKNEKILWKSSDEFSKLIEEYNRMIEEMEISAQKLADSERESGWRDMAQQVAHEIKNPLTPMKLSIQHLQRTWKEKSDLSAEQMTRFANSLIQQIDALADIADEFSNFAKIPKSHRQLIKVNEIITAAIDVYDGSDITFHISGFENLTMNADPGLLLRVFNNLIRNSVQSFRKERKKEIWIKAQKEYNQLKITVKDCGCGIPQEMLPRIFIPTFTTRSTGMGLGLAVVKTIVEEHNGNIAVHSTEGEGTVFTMTFKLN
jgi:nitrogen fixation/metabolism regulation signal transduction histidine kinase